jgi:CRP/FNR family transcriptional regulator
MNMQDDALKVLQDSVLIEELKGFSESHTFPAETTILEFQHPIRVLPFLLSGSVKVMGDDEHGNEILLYYIKPGETCIMSILGALNNDRSKVRAIVDDEAEMLLIPVEKTQYLVSKFPSWSSFIFKLYHKRFEELLRMVNSIAFTKVDQRLEDLLKNKAENLNTSELSVTHKQLADELGTAREVVSRLLKQMEKQGKLTLGRNKISLSESVS